MEIRKAIRESFIFRFLLKIKEWSEASFLFSFDLSDKNKNIEGQDYRTWVNTSFIYGFLMKIDSFLNRIEKFLYNSYLNSSFYNLLPKRDKSKILDKSLVYQKASQLKGDRRWLDLLVFIPASYFVVDYIIRRTRGLAALGSIWDEMALIVLLFYIIYRRIESGGQIKYNFTPMGLPAAIYVLMGLSHIFIIAPNLGVAIEGFRAVFQHILWYFILTQFIREIDDAKIIINLMLSIGLFMGLHAIYQYITKVPMPGNWVDATENITTRAFSIVGSPNILGVIFVLLIPMAVGMLLSKTKTSMKAFYFLTSAVMTLGLLLTLSRGAWLAFAFSVFIFIVVLNPKMLIPFMGFVGAFILFGGSLSQRLLFMLSPAYLAKSGKGGRLYRWDIGLEMWRRNRLFGVGLGRFGGAVAINNQLAPFYLDNYYLKTLAEMGIYGVVGLAFIVVCFIIFSARVIKNQESFSNRIICIGLFSGALGVLVQNFVENIFEVPAMIIYFWIVVAMLNAFAPKPVGERMVRK